MEKYMLKEDVKLFYIPVPTFPLGIKEAFQTLIDVLNNNLQGRDFYGISWFDEQGNIVYNTAVTEAYTGEGKKFGFDSLTINKGEYLAEKISNWMAQTDKIKEVFMMLMKEKSYDNTRPCVEWYKSDDEMLCMVKSKTVTV